MARPTKYDEQILIDTADYIENHADYDDLVPSVAGLAYYLKVGKSTIYDWSKEEDKEEFSDMLAQILVKQEKMLLSGGLSSAMSGTIVKLMLSKHGYSDSSKTDHTSSDGTMSPKKDFNDFYKDK
jgi:hypothetical protein